MKGVVFTEFFEMLEKEHGYAFVNQLIDQSKLKSMGVYTAVGTYPSGEMVSLVNTLSEMTNISTADLYKTFGKYLFKSFLGYYPDLIKGFNNSFDFFERIDDYIHVEVNKLYPDAELPSFDIERLSNDSIKMLYSSKRKMADLAEGLIEAALEHWNEDGYVVKEKINTDGNKVLFTVNLNN